MIRVLVDSNVLVDFLARRGDFYGFARKLMVFAEMGDYELWVSSSQVTDVFYVLSNGGRASCVPAAREALLALRRFVRVCAPGEREVDRALESDWPDFEDVLVYQVATSIDALASGIALAAVDGNIYWAVAFIGVITFFLSASGVKLGSIAGCRYKSKAELAGGIILICIGAKILFEHMAEGV